MKLQSRLIATLLPIVLIATVLALIGSILLQTPIVHERRVSFLESYIAERGKREALLFNRLTKAHEQTNFWFETNMRELTGPEIDTTFDAIFELVEDGSYRTRDALFDGTYIRGMGEVHGVGGFIPDRGELTRDRKRVLVSAFAALTHTAPNIETDLESLWFVAPQGGILIFAPNREDKLEFYRKTAPADFDYREVADFLDNISFEHNPAGETKCIPLSQLVYVKSGRALTTGCQTPSRFDGRQYGAWGTTMPMEESFKAAVEDVPLTSSELFFLGADAELMAHKTLIGLSVVTQEDVDAIIPDKKRRRLVEEFEKSGRTSGVITLKDSWGPGDLYSFYHIEIADWYIVIKLDGGAIFAQAMTTILPVFSFTLVVVLLTITSITHLVSRYGIRPLRRLAKTFRNARSSESGLKQVVGVSDLTRRDDELGDLARALSSYHDESVEHLSTLEKRVSERTTELKQANDAKTIFLANMSHELRTPLNGILGLAGSLRHRIGKEDLKEQVGLIEQSAQTLETLLTDVLDISMVEAGRLELKATPFDLKKALRSIIDLHAIAADDKGLRVIRDCDDITDGAFIGDPVRIKQVAWNLLSNAIKFTDKGEIKLTLTGEHVENDVYKVCLSVKDTGIGISKEHQERIFDRFSQATSAIHRQYGGTGLGLSIVKSLTQLMGGDVVLKSQPGVGSEFICSFMLKKTVSDKAHEDAELKEDQVNSEFAGLSVLLAEDHAVNRRVVELIVESQGAHVFSVGNGADAVETFKTDQYDIVLMDVRMPVCDGLEAVRRIREYETSMELSPTPIVMLTANTTDTDIDAAFSAGATSHLGKPLTPEKLLAAIASVVNAENAGPAFAAPRNRG